MLCERVLKIKSLLLHFGGFMNMAYRGISALEFLLFEIYVKV